MSLINLTIIPKPKDLGGFSVRSILPSAQRQMVGPFIFLDHLGPATFAQGEGINVRPHPHIGLATVTYLFQGELLHRDLLGSKQVITPGAINWMTASRGIVHSEKTSPDDESRFIEWNFVSSSHERIAQAKADWKAGLFDKVPGDEKEFIPLPE